MMKKLLMCILCTVTITFAQQIAIPRIDAMPNQPAPYAMRNWRNVTLGYDSLVFNSSLTGDYLPLIFFQSQGTNYPSHGFFGLSTVVGTTRTASTEAINALPALVGASLAGVNKRNQSGNDYVLMAEDYFNKRASENVYLNSPAAQSGDDWWYETMPNVYFYQLNSLYPHTGDFDNQFPTVANRWLTAVQAMGAGTAPWKLPYMNYRAFSLSNMTPLTTGVIEPEASGAIAWILYNAYKVKKDESYRIGAEQAMEFLSGLTSNPAYELQLAYGTYNAARMNAELGTDYNVEKMVNWCFEVGSLRTWGSMVGNWGGYDVSGLIGENNSNGYAFIMNGFHQVGALVPMVRYDERFASAIGKWALNLANASRLFYPNYLPDQNQDSRAWSKQYDPNSYIAHEAIRQTLNGMTPYATGDAISGGWGKTNLALYSSSSVGYLGAILDTTNIEKILRLDLLKTDFYHDTAFASYLYYNPYTTEQTISVTLPSGSYDIYDAVSNSFLTRNASGTVSVALPANTSRIIVLPPAGGVETYDGEKLLINGVVVDFHSGQTHGNLIPRIKSLAPANTPLPVNGSTQFYCTAVSRNGDTLSYSWSADSGKIAWNRNVMTYQAPATPGSYTITCTVNDQHGGQVSKSFLLSVIQRINHVPVINQITALPRKVTIGSLISAVCLAVDSDTDNLSYEWRLGTESVIGTGSILNFTVPSIIGNYYLSCTVSDGMGGITKDSTIIVVRDFANYQTGNLQAYYPFNGNANDESGNANNGFAYLTTLTKDRFGKANSAYLFDGATSYIQIHNTTALNFRKGITLNFWMTPKYFYTTREQYPISHGNWEKRWKVSLTNNKLRWTVKTDAGVRDLDAVTTLQLDSLYNVTALFDGMSMEIYINGKLDAVTPFSGQILVSDVDLTFGEVVPANTAYNFNGVLDDIRLYDYALLPDAINQFYDITSDIKNENGTKQPTEFSLASYPNPCNAQVTLNVNILREGETEIVMHDILGRMIKTFYKGKMTAGTHQLAVDVSDVASGIYFIMLNNNSQLKTNKIVILK